jgi:hypothetical protein
MKALGGLFLLICTVLGGCAARDIYRNNLCDSRGGAIVHVTAAAWRSQHRDEITAIAPVKPSDAYHALGPQESRTLLNSRFAEEIRQRDAGVGITEHDFRLVDIQTQVVLATWIRFYTGGNGSSKLPFQPLVPMADSCFTGSREYLQLREELTNIERACPNPAFERTCAKSRAVRSLPR